MEASTITAVIAVGSALSLAFINNFVAERYRRFHDGSALAAGLAGELAAYALPMQNLRTLLASSVAAAVAGRREEVTFYRISNNPRDAFYEASASRLGLLGSALVEQVALSYGLIQGFRANWVVLVEHHKTMPDAELHMRLVGTLSVLNGAAEHAGRLIPLLQARALEPFLWRPKWSVGRTS